MLFLPSIIGYGVLAVTLVAFLVAQRSGSVRRNSFIGIRTTKTMRSDEAWTAGHHAASRYLATAAAVAALCGVALAVVGASGVSETVGHVVGPSGYLLVLAVVVAGAVAAGRAADRA